MKKITSVLLLMLLVAASVMSQTPQPDIKGSKDHPLLTRMPDFFIASYNESEFNSYRFTGANREQIVVEGHKYYFEYRLQTGAAEPGELKIRRNIQAAIKKINGKVVFEDDYNKITTMVVQKGDKETWLEVRSYNTFYRMNIVEKEVMEQEIVANADAMGNDINSTGHVSVYGIFFDTGKSEIKLESDAAVEQISMLLKNNGTLKLYVVGHTDNVGTLDANLKLSKDRANAVVNLLTTKYAIPADRLISYGVASLTPVASNDSEEGRAKNRRVELVKQ